MDLLHRLQPATEGHLVADEEDLFGTGRREAAQVPVEEAGRAWLAIERHRGLGVSRETAEMRLPEAGREDDGFVDGAGHGGLSSVEWAVEGWGGGAERMDGGAPAPPPVAAAPATDPAKSTA